MNIWSGRILLGAIVLMAFIMRFWELTRQSFWLDELYTVLIADPGKDWSWLFSYLRCCELHPPLLYVLERLLLAVAGYTEYAARSLTAAAGTISILAIYFLGKELFDKKTGLIAAALTTVNHFNLWYSQDARSYIFAFLFSALSFLYLIRFIKTLNRRAAIGYGIFTLLLLYTHYFSLFILAAQILTAGIFWALEKENKNQFLKNYLLSGAIILLGYLPWLPFLAGMSEIRSTWMTGVDHHFLTNFFFEYFGHSALLEPFLVAFLLIYILRVIQTKRNAGIPIKKEPLLFSFIVFSCWIFITYLLPYVRSLLVIPMLLPRYTIVVLPAYLIILASGVALISSGFIRYTVLTLFLTLSLIDLIVVDDYYRSVQKTQFREMTAYISADSTERFPIVNEKTSWEQSFYLRKFGNEAPVLTGPKEDIIDSILQESSKDYDLPAFWLAGAHGDTRLSSEKHKQLEESYYLVKQKDFHDAWAQLFARKDSALVLDHQYFNPDRIIETEGEKIVAIWGGAIHSRPVYLENGRYTLVITAKGTPLEGVFPHLNVFSNDVKTGDFSLSDTYEDYEFPLILNEDAMVTFRLGMDNDAHNPTTGEDRNAFVRYIICKEGLP